jgi:hypothetical protein
VEVAFGYCWVECVVVFVDFDGTLVEEEISERKLKRKLSVIHVIYNCSVSIVLQSHVT